MKTPCKKCIVKAMCTETCDKFQLPKGKNVLYFLRNSIRSKRLLNHHIKNSICRIYHLNRTESVTISHSVCWYDSSYKFKYKNKIENSEYKSNTKQSLFKIC